LPFHVLAVDVIAGEAYVSVDYAHHVSPMALDDLLGSWRLDSADYDSNTAEFVNEKNQFVRVNLKGV